jgi:hypothetical protein
MNKAGCALAVITLVAGTAFAQAPVPVAERVVTERNLATRVTLFSNGAIVVSMRRDERQDFLRRITLPDDQYMVYLVAFQKNAEELGKEPISSDVSTSTNVVQLTLHIGPEAPRLLRFSPMAVVSLPLSRIQGALDDLERIVLEANPSTEEIRNWTPRPGDRVQLMTGGFARVIEVLPEGVVVLEHEDTFIREMVPPGALDQVILHVVDSKP